MWNWFCGSSDAAANCGVHNIWTVLYSKWSWIYIGADGYEIWTRLWNGTAGDNSTRVSAILASSCEDTCTSGHSANGWLIVCTSAFEQQAC